MRSFELHIKQLEQSFSKKEKTEKTFKHPDNLSARVQAYQKDAKNFGILSKVFDALPPHDPTDNYVLFIICKDMMKELKHEESKHGTSLTLNGKKTTVQLTKSSVEKIQEFIDRVAQKACEELFDDTAQLKPGIVQTLRLNELKEWKFPIQKQDILRQIIISYISTYLLRNIEARLQDQFKSEPWRYELFKQQFNQSLQVDTHANTEQFDKRIRAAYKEFQLEKSYPKLKIESIIKTHIKELNHNILLPKKISWLETNWMFLRSNLVDYQEKNKLSDADFHIICKMAQIIWQMIENYFSEKIGLPSNKKWGAINRIFFKAYTFNNMSPVEIAKKLIRRINLEESQIDDKKTFVSYLKAASAELQEIRDSLIALAEPQYLFPTKTPAHPTLSTKENIQPVKDIAPSRPKIKVNKTLVLDSDVKYTKAVDTFNNKGKSTGGITVEAKKRQQFFKDRPDLESLLKRHPKNPLLEEGKYTPENREKTGEYFITYEALALLVDKKIIQHKPKQGGIPYNNKNVFVIQDAKNVDNLEKILRGLDLKEGEDTKLIHIHGIHAVPVYLRKENGKIKCFIVDPEANYGKPNEIIHAVQKVFPDTFIVWSKAHLQKDFYSCSTFAIKALMYFAKHGTKVFPHIEKTIPSKSGIFGLASKNLMPALLKMCQTPVDASKEALETIVSTKAKKTLGQYWKEYQQDFEKKTFNTAAIKKKYKYLSELDTYIQSRIKVDNDKSDAANIPEKGDLPISLAKVRDKLSTVPVKKLEMKSSQKKSTEPAKKLDVKRPEKTARSVDNSYISRCERILAHLKGDSKTPLDKSASQLLIEIERIHPPLKKEFQLSLTAGQVWTNDKTNQLAQLLYLAIAKELKQLDYLELIHYTEKLLSLFGDYKHTLEYLKRHVDETAIQPIHDACLFDLPDSQEVWDKKRWANLIIEHGKKASVYLPLAPKIDQALNEQAKNKKDDKHSNDVVIQLSDIERIHQTIALTSHYKRAMENPVLAKLAIEHKKSEATFESCLSLIETGRIPKKSDLLPDFSIEYKEKGSKYTFKKLPVDDLRGLFLGEYTACCQSIGSAGGECAIHGMTSPYAGFYVVIDDRERIVAQTFACLGPKGEIVLDSWELINKQGQAHLCEAFLDETKDIFLAHGFTSVMIGRGGNTPRDLILLEAKTPTQLRGYKGYSDSRSEQLVVAKEPSQDLIIKYKKYVAEKKLTHQPFISQSSSIDNAISSLLKDSKNIDAESCFSFCLFLYKNGRLILQELVKQNKQEQFVQLLRALGNNAVHLLSLPDNEGKTILRTAAENNNISLLEAIRSVIPSQQLHHLFVIDAILHRALEHGSVNFINNLLENHQNHNKDQLLAHPLRDIEHLPFTWSDYRNLDKLYDIKEKNTDTAIESIFKYYSNNNVPSTVPTLQAYLNSIRKIDSQSVKEQKGNDKKNHLLLEKSDVNLTHLYYAIHRRPVNGLAIKTLFHYYTESISENQRALLELLLDTKSNLFDVLTYACSIQNLPVIQYIFDYCKDDKSTSLELANQMESLFLTVIRNDCTKTMRLLLEQKPAIINSKHLSHIFDISTDAADYRSAEMMDMIWNECHKQMDNKECQQLLLKEDTECGGIILNAFIRSKYNIYGLLSTILNQCSKDEKNREQLLTSCTPLGNNMLHLCALAHPERAGEARSIVYRFKLITLLADEKTLDQMLEKKNCEGQTAKEILQSTLLDPACSRWTRYDELNCIRELYQLYQTLSAVKKEVNNPKWNNAYQILFYKTVPRDIQKLRDLLQQLPDCLTPEYKWDNLTRIQGNAGLFCDDFNAIFYECEKQLKKVPEQKLKKT